jgi:tripartite ATP-independent transporter DctP family solute receptor
MRSGFALPLGPILARCLALSLLLALRPGLLAADPALVLRYVHMNEDSSVAGQQARFFAGKAREYTKGEVSVEVYPASQFGSLDEQLAAVAAGTVAFHHTTAAGLGIYYPDFAVLDSPYIYRDVDHLLAVVKPDSPVMKRLADGLLKAVGLRVLYTFYFGARELSCDRPVLRPADLAGLKIRSIPYPIYGLAVEALGATAIPLDWAKTPTALATGALDGQENPVNTILSAGLHRSQPWLMLTDHILGAEIVVVNEAAWKKLSPPAREGITRAAAEAGAWATARTREQESLDLRALKGKGMKVIGPAEGLDIGAFRERAAAMLGAAYGEKWAEYYRLIDSLGPGRRESPR